MTVRRATPKDAPAISAFLQTVFAADPLTCGQVETSTQARVLAGMGAAVYWLDFDASKKLQGVLRLAANGVSLFDPKEFPWAEKGRAYTVNVFDLLVALDTLTSLTGKTDVYKELTLFAANDLRDSGGAKEVILIHGPTLCRGAGFGRQLGAAEKVSGGLTYQALPFALIWDAVATA